jgi:hypothetical protein
VHPRLDRRRKKWPHWPFGTGITKIRNHEETKKDNLKLRGYGQNGGGSYHWLDRVWVYGYFDPVMSSKGRETAGAQGPRWAPNEPVDQFGRGGLSVSFVDASTHAFSLGDLKHDARQLFASAESIELCRELRFPQVTLFRSPENTLRLARSELMQHGHIQRETIPHCLSIVGMHQAG